MTGLISDTFYKYIKGLLCISAAGILFFTGRCFAMDEWIYSGYGIKEACAKIILAGAADNKMVYAATDYFLYVSDDAGSNWRQAFAAGGSENTINFICLLRSKKTHIFVATQDGLYVSGGALSEWNKVFDRQVNCVVADSVNKRIYIAAENGIFVSGDLGITWRLIYANAASESVQYIALSLSGDIIYANSSGRILSFEVNGLNWKILYSSIRGDVLDDIEEDPQEQENFAGIRSLFVDMVDPNRIYAATSKGVLYSEDAGHSWFYITGVGFAAGAAGVNHVVLFDNSLYCATSEGVFMYNSDKGAWKQLWQGSGFKDALFLSFNPDTRMLWAATLNGIFKMQLAQKATLGLEMKLPQHIIERFKYEPSIAQVQRVAVRYAEVHPDKISKWRTQARIKAFVPEFDLGYDKSISLYTNNNYTVGPNDWSIDLKWNLGDLIFSTDQTSIDVRSRLTTQLRDDILDDVTRLYYERRRLQVELIVSLPDNEKEKYDKLLRLEELTADIDGLTGGWFSANLEKA